MKLLHTRAGSCQYEIPTVVRKVFVTARPSLIHVIDSLHPSAGGPSRTVVQLTDALAQNHEFNVSLISQRLAGDPAIPSTGTVNRCVIESKYRAVLSLGLTAKHVVTRLSCQQSPILIHSHGLWSPLNHWAAVIARRKGIPLIIHPRGMLEPWALSQKAFKKQVAMAVFQRSDIENSNLIVATSVKEYEGIRAFGFKNPVAIIPNGVMLATVNPNVTKRSQPADGDRSVLFLSRIHRGKGLINLLYAWAAISPVGWRLKIAGPDQYGHLDEIKRAAQKLGIVNSIDYLGEIDGEDKSGTYENANLFVLPTYSENFGVVIAEALTFGLPVITTRGAPWSDLESHDCGWWIDIGIEPLVLALRKAMKLTDTERRAMGERGMEFVKRYNWCIIAAQLADVYRWVMKDGHQPACVEMR